MRGLYLEIMGNKGLNKVIDLVLDRNNKKVIYITYGDHRGKGSQKSSWMTIEI
jgi:catabolite regulation protein CreA